MTRDIHTWFLIACVSVGFVVGGCSTSVPMTGRSQLSMVSAPAFNVQCARLYHGALAASVTNPDPAQLRRVRTVGEKLVAAVESYLLETGHTDLVTSFDWEFNVLVDSARNAFSLAGGKVAVNTGILDVLEQDAELATLLAHEVAHVVAGHGAERRSNEVMTQMGGLLVQVAAAADEQTSDQTQALGDIYTIAANLGFLRPHSRTHELEADHMGLIIMAMAGYHPSYAVALWRKMYELDGNGDTPLFLSTHPLNSDRIRQMEALIPTVMPIYRKAKLLGR